MDEKFPEVLKKVRNALDILEKREGTLVILEHLKKELGTSLTDIEFEWALLVLERDLIISRPQPDTITRKKSLPSEPALVQIQDIRSKHIDTQIIVEGTLVLASDVRPQVTSAKFECPKCKAILVVLQVDKKFREPAYCSCGNKKDFTILSQAFVDTQRLTIGSGEIQWDKELCGSGGARPEHSLNVFLQESLCDPQVNIFAQENKPIRVIGMLRNVPVSLEDHSFSTRQDFGLEAESIQFPPEQGVFRK